MTNQTKKRLDDLLVEYKAQPVGNGYVDVIVSRENYLRFAKALIENGFIIESISWWEHLEEMSSQPKHGLRGPESTYYSGWFSELCCDLDEVPVSQNPLSVLLEAVDGKVFGMHETELVSFKNTKSLTPAFWIKIDDDWKNRG